MKKIILFILPLLLTFSLSAQNDEIFGNNKNENPFTSQSNMQEAGSHVIEVSFNPGNIFGSGSGDIFSLINGTIKYRHFKSDTKAMRYGVKLFYFSDTDITQQANDDFDLLELKDYTTVYSISFMPGMEKHFKVSDKISPYIGWQLLLGYQATSLVEEYQDDKDIETLTFSNSSGHAGEGLLNVGAGVFSGVDYYFVKHFYVGVELGIGVGYSKKLATKYIDSGDSDSDIELKNGSRFVLAPGLTTGNIRLGWTF